MDIESLINKHKDAVYRQMVRVCGNYEDAEDALADAFLAALKSSDQLKDPNNFRAWLAKIGMRVCIRKRIADRLLRSVSLSSLQERGIELSDEHRSPDIEAEIHIVQQCVQNAVATLPDIYRDVYVRREILGEKAEDVANQLNLSISAVKSRLHRARAIARVSFDSGFGCSGLGKAVD